MQTLLEYEADKTIPDINGERAVNYASNKTVEELLTLPPIAEGSCATMNALRFLLIFTTIIFAPTIFAQLPPPNDLMLATQVR